MPNGSSQSKSAAASSDHGCAGAYSYRCRSQANQVASKQTAADVIYPTPDCYSRAYSCLSAVDAVLANAVNDVVLQDIRKELAKPAPQRLDRQAVAIGDLERQAKMILEVSSSLTASPHQPHRLASSAASAPPPRLISPQAPRHGRRRGSTSQPPEASEHGEGRCLSSRSARSEPVGDVARDRSGSVGLADQAFQDSVIKRLNDAVRALGCEWCG